MDGRGERIRTSDLSVPNRAHYQAVLRPEITENFKKPLPQGQHSKSQGELGQADHFSISRNSLIKATAFAR